jgi:hypothetical protein
MTLHFKRYIISHVLVYLIIGIIGMFFMNYKDVFLTNDYFNHFRPLDSPIVRAAVLFQIIRAALIALILYPFKETLVTSKYGWLYLFGLLFGLTGILSLPAAPGTIEGFIYTDVSFTAHFIGMPEILIQSLGISLLYWRWYKQRRA